MGWQILLLFILIILSGFFSGAEVALLSVTPIRVRTYLKEKRRGSAALSRLKSNTKRMIIIILIGNNVVNIVAASMVAIIATNQFGRVGLGISAGLLTLLILIVGEIIPKTLASRYAGWISLSIARTIEIFGYTLYPLVFLLESLIKGLEKFVKFKSHAAITEADIKSMIEFGVEQNIIHPEEQYIINRALAFSDISAKNIMIPLPDVFLMASNSYISESLGKIIDSGFTRIPIYEGSKENIKSIAIVKDIARELMVNKSNKMLKDVAITPIYVPENIRIDLLFKIFQSKRKHMAIVQSISRKTVGIVTLEDLIEELVGEIADESDVRK